METRGKKNPGDVYLRGLGFLFRLRRQFLFKSDMCLEKDHQKKKNCVTEGCLFVSSKKEGEK